MTIAAILDGKGDSVISTSGDASVADAVTLLAEKRIGAVPVLSGRTVAGIFSERDVLYCVAREGAAALNRKVSEVMTAPAITVEPGESVLGALALMTKRRIRHLPVVEAGACVGFVSIGDLVKYRIERIESEAEAMRVYIQTA
ncbi:CBS domain-containing protein [Sphingomonas sp.]|uniref:CBS domain-containing protein n=1 Tax=Sphingomonas sp. TaxID=28214 RepID=UPI001B227F31|nr:CBS domain-containing protein [Sphingomonas sp.]MBO9713189.1 CBS domain-containing protein [Sphingomonas sp.]